MDSNKKMLFCCSHILSANHKICKGNVLLQILNVPNWTAQLIAEGDTTTNGAKFELFMSVIILKLQKPTDW